MKKLHILTAALIVAVTVLAFSAFSVSAANARPKAYVNTASVNVRIGAGTEYDVVGNLSKKTKVTLLSGKLYNSDWYYIKLENGIKCYIHKDYLTINKNQLYIPDTAKAYAGYPAKYKNFVNTTGQSAVWKSSDTSIAEIDKYTGKITSHKAGSVTITVKAGGLKCSGTLNLIKAEVSLSETAVEMFTDDTFRLSASCVKPVTFKSGDTSIATVSSDGLITPVSTGTVKIKASSASDSAVCTITIKKREIFLSASRKTIYSGCHSILTASGGKYAYSFKSTDTNVLTVDSGGIITGVSAGKAKVICTSGELSKSVTVKVKQGTAVSFSGAADTLKKGMTLYVKCPSSAVKWKSSDTDVATVDGGFVYGAGKGTAIISAYTSSGEKDFVLKVTSPEPVRFAYTSENSAKLGQTVKFYAITDTARTDVKFVLTNSKGKSGTLKNPVLKKSGDRYIWMCEKALKTAGNYDVVAYSHTAFGGWKTCDGGKCVTYATDTSSRTAVSYAPRRATTKAIKNIASYEGFLPNVTPDELVADTPTVGYGRVVYAGTVFYNGMTKNEAYAYLVKTVNDGGYTSKVNEFLTSNNIKFNQPQFDALVDFSYNLGIYALSNNSDLSSVLKNCYGKESYKNKAYTNRLNVVLRSEAKDSADVLKTLEPNTTVKLDSTKLYNKSWYKATVSGVTGYIYKSHVTRLSTNTEVRSLKNVRADVFAKAFLPYHHASGVCYWGLLYRRMDELELFCYNDYSLNGSSNNYGITYYCPRNDGFGVG